MDDLHFSLRSAAWMMVFGTGVFWLLGIPLAYAFFAYMSLPASAGIGYLQVLADSLDRSAAGIVGMATGVTDARERPDLLVIMTFTLPVPLAALARSLWSRRAYAAELTRQRVEQEARAVAA
jgi:hypothetical protein